MLRLVGLLVAAITISMPTPARACRVVEVTFVPTANLQIVMWLEDAQGQFIDTVYITAATGSRGLGNRPGILEFNSEYLWPYGRRETVFPVWAHRHGKTFPRIVFQDGFDRDLSHPFDRSSLDPYFCRPLKTGEPTQIQSVDTSTCATTAYTDKGTFDAVQTSLYPPRNDLNPTQGVDSAAAAMFAQLNTFDAVSRATPAGGRPYKLAFKVPATLPDGNYTVWVEVSKEKDMNAAYSYPSPNLVAYGEYGYAYRGQPSVVWSIPIRVDDQPRAAVALDYVGYGDPDGIDGNLRRPDGTISADAEGSGAKRLVVATAPEGTYRVRVATSSSIDGAPPMAPTDPAARAMSATEAELTFVEPNDSSVTGYEVLYAVGQEMTADNIDQVGHRVDMQIAPGAPGATKTIQLTGLFPQTKYWLAVRSHDDCLNHSAPALATVSTPTVQGGEVSTCFVATAAYGSALHEDVARLRGFRDRYLRSHVLGELLVESYYTFGPAAAAVIRPSPDLRRLARSALAPVVNLVP
ncbi:MAG TPA: fibronectin type III domain-containing protein [Haliangiales bacterium]|nr:fibronectin type III domain-containing protein [Haliangiales bacterium]